MAAHPAMVGPSVWLGRDMVNASRWLRDLPAGGKAELDAALDHVRRRGLAWHQITRDDFPLPTLAPLIADIAEELEHGSGIMKLRGVPVTGYDEDDLRRLYFGLGSHVGRPVFQNRRGELMRAIRDEGAEVGQ